MELAPGWKVDAVLKALQNRERLELARFIECRYETRFFEPISCLEKASIQAICKPEDDFEWYGPIRPYGFAIMSLACLMIETLESYSRGIPTTNKEDFKRILRDYPSRPKEVECADTDIPGTKKAFKEFFEIHKSEFQGLNGEDFYHDIRNALLHQSQTRNGWVINIHHPSVASSRTDEVFTGRCLYRDSFIFQLRKCFANFVCDLRDNPDGGTNWRNSERKIWWVAWLSDPQGVIDWLRGNPAGTHAGRKRNG